MRSENAHSGLVPVPLVATDQRSRTYVEKGDRHRAVVSFLNSAPPLARSQSPFSTPYLARRTETGGSSPSSAAWGGRCPTRDSKDV